MQNITTAWMTRAPVAALVAALIPGTVAAAVNGAVPGKPRPWDSVSATAITGSGPAGQPGVDYAADHVLVEFEQKAGAQASRRAVQALGGSVAATLENRPGMATVSLGSQRTVAEAVRAYRADPRVAHAQPNYIYRAAATPNDSEFDDLWGLDNTGQTVDGISGVADRDIDAEAAWDLKTDCSATRVAVVDAGVNYTHADLADNMWDGATNHGRDFVGNRPDDPTSANDDDPMPYGGALHGTHVAGTIAAVGDNGEGTTGVCWQAEIMSVRVLGPDGTGFTSDIVEGIDYAVNNGAQILNLSFGQFMDDAALKDSLENARDNGALVVAAAGNSNVNVNQGSTPVYPCSYDLDNILCVAALNQDYQRASFSNFGDSAVDVGAPGVNVSSAFPGPTVSTDFTNWTTDASWDVDNCSVGGGNIQLLTNPSDWNNGNGVCAGARGQYANDLDARAYKVFDLGGAIGGGYSYLLDLDLASTDTASNWHEAGASPGTPFDAGTNDGSQTGGETRGFQEFANSVADCAGTKCSIGFRVRTDGSGTDFGGAIALFEVQKVVDSTTATDFLDGTSMAAPHATGVAALAWSVVPGKGYDAIREAVMDGGDDVMALDGITNSGRGVNARGAIETANDAPLPPDADLSTEPGEQITVDLTANDPNGHSVSYSVGMRPSNGTVSLSGSTARYTPDDGYTGEDSFTVKASDAFTGESTAAVSVEVEPADSSGGGGGGGGGSVGLLLLLLVGGGVTLRQRETV